MSRRKILSGMFLGILLPAALLFLGVNAFSRPAASATGLMGTVKSAEGNALEGVGVSARNSAESFTTTVYTDQDGRFIFLSLIHI